MGAFSTFWLFSAKPVDSWRVLSSITTRIGAGDSLVLCDSKTAGKKALFSCFVPSGDCDDSDELRLVVSVSAVGRKTTSLGDNGLA